MVKVNNVIKNITGGPLISFTSTRTVSNTTTILKTALGDKITSDHPVSTTVGKANGLINLDVATSTEGTKTATASTPLASQSVSVNSSGMVGLGLTAGQNEVHVGYGLGFGLGEYNWGSSHTSNGVTTGQDYNVRPGGGAAIGEAFVVGTVLTDGALAPVGAAAIKLVTQ